MQGTLCCWAAAHWRHLQASGCAQSIRSISSSLNLHEVRKTGHVWENLNLRWPHASTNKRRMSEWDGKESLQTDRKARSSTFPWNMRQREISTPNKKHQCTSKMATQTMDSTYFQKQKASRWGPRCCPVNQWMLRASITQTCYCSEVLKDLGTTQNLEAPGLGTPPMSVGGRTSLSTHLRPCWWIMHSLSQRAAFMCLPQPNATLSTFSQLIPRSGASAFCFPSHSISPLNEHCGWTTIFYGTLIAWNALVPQFCVFLVIVTGRKCSSPSADSTFVICTANGLVCLR